MISYVMFLDDLLKACIVELGELGQVVNIRDDIIDVRFQEHELLFGGSIMFGIRRVTIGRRPRAVVV